MSIERKCLVISTACFTPINRNLYHELSKNLDVTLLIPKELKIGSKKHLAEILDINSAKYSVFSCKFLFGNNLRFTLIMSSFKYLKMVKPNYVILDFDPFSLISLQFIIFSFFFKFKIITLTYENRKINKLDFKNINANLIIKYIFYFLFKNLLVKKIFNVVTFNKTGQIIFINYGFNTSLTVLGVNTNIFHISNETRNLIRQSYKIKSDQVVISYFGRLVPEKGVHILLEGLSLIKHNNLVLLIDKFDTYRNDYSIKISIQLNNLSHIKVIQVDPSHEDMWKFMNATDLVILPSITTNFWEEQYGRVASESMACGKLVLVSNSGHLPDLVNKFGIVFNQNDVNSLVDTLKKHMTMSSISNFYSKEEIRNYAISNLSISNQISFFNKLMQ